MNIKKIREKIGMSQERLSEITKLRIASISRIENGHVRPHPATLKIIADALGVTVNELKGE